MNRPNMKAMLLAVAASGMSAGFAQAALPIAENGEARAVIVHHGHTAVAPNLREEARRQGPIPSAVDALQDYLQQITGAELPVVASLDEAGDRPAIVFELVDRLPGASDRPTAGEAYRIKTTGNRLTLTAATALGLHHAVHGLLEDHLGCRFYTMKRAGLGYGGRGFEIVPRQPTLILAAIDDLQEPAFANRGLIFKLGTYPWVLQNRGVGLVGDTTSGALAAGHNMYNLLPPRDGKQGKGLFADHPEFYPMNREGERQPDWAYGICGTNPDLPTFLAQGLERDFQQHVAAAKGGEVDWSRPFKAGQGDGFSGCQCPACRKLVLEEQSEAAPLIMALNRALAILGKDYPKAQVITFAYFETLDAPKTIKPHPNLWINVVSSACSQNAGGDQMGPIRDNPANRDYERAIREWPKIAPNRVTVWHWDTYRAEWPSMFYIADNWRLMRDAGIYGVNPQTCGGPWDRMIEWLHFKLAWNPDLDNDALVRQYCEDVYGQEAGGHLYDYLKLGQKAVEASLHVPSAVRWSGWTEITRQKIFQPYLAAMTEAMDQATAAAEHANDPLRLANLNAARGVSLDVLSLNEVAAAGKPWGLVRHPGDGQDWFVAGADPRIPLALMRRHQGLFMDGGGEHGILRAIATSFYHHGGPVVPLAGPSIEAIVCPGLAGRIVSAIDRASGKELLANLGAESGYADVIQRVRVQLWLPPDQARNLPNRRNEDWSRLWSDFRSPTPDRLDTHLTLSPGHYGFDASRSMRRSVQATSEGIRIERAFTGKPDTPNRLTARWRLALPEPKSARVAVQGGGIQQVLDLRHAVPGGIVGVKAGERLPGADWMDERIDTVIAVSDAEVTRLPVEATEGGEIVVTLDRGDGVAAMLTTTAAGWEAVEIKPVVDRRYLEITLVGALIATGEGESVDNLALPPQTLVAKAVAGAKDQSDRSDQSDAPAAAPPRLRLTGTSAVNEADGAELVWIPAGAFLRGSPEDGGGGDERPRREIELDGYWIYKHPVTLAQYEAFVAASQREFKPMWAQQGRWAPADANARQAMPIFCNWYEAEAYAHWAGGALPSEAQWEKAARGEDGREYPWGDEWDPKKCASMEETLYTFIRGFQPVGSYPEGASPYGVMDMAGNGWEWTADWYDHQYYHTAPDKNPPGPETGTHKALRGGCSLYDERFSRTAARMLMPPQTSNWTPIGFRLVIVAPGPGE